MGILPARRVLGAIFERAHHWRAARRLHRDHARALAADESDGFEFGESLPHANQTCAAAGRIEDHVRHVPAELLGKLKPHRFLAFDAIRLLQRRGIEPASLGLALADDLAAIVDQPVDAIDRRALQLDLADIHLRRIRGTKDRGPDAATGRISRERRSSIAVGRHRHVLDAERLAHRDCHYQPARLKRAGRQPALVLDDDLAAAGFPGKFVKADKRRRDLAETDDIGDFANRQHLAVAPEIGRPLLKRIFGQRLLHAGKIVSHQKRLVRLGEIVDLIGGVVIAFHRAFEVGHERRAFDRQIVIVFHRIPFR